MGNAYMTDEESFVDHLRLCADRNWMKKYFNLIAEIISITGLRSDDPRIVSSIVTNNAYIPITINNRYVLVSSKQNYNASIICQQQFSDRTDLHLGVVHTFGQLPGEKAQNDTPPVLVKIDETLDICQELRDSIYGWKRTLLIETTRAKASPYKRYHNASVYKAATDREYRDFIFKTAYDIE